MSSADSFRTRRTLHAGGRDVQYYSLPALQDDGFPDVARLPFSLKILLENLLRHEDGRFVKAADIEALARWDVKSTAAQGDLLRAGARAAAGLHRRALRRRSRGDARRHRAARRQSRPGQPAAAGRARHRSLGAGGLLRPGRRVPAERRARVLAQQGALRVPALGAERVPQFPRRAARHRHRAPGEPRVPRARRRVRRRGRAARSRIRTRSSAPTRTRR